MADRRGRQAGKRTADKGTGRREQHVAAVSVVDMCTVAVSIASASTTVAPMAVALKDSNC